MPVLAGIFSKKDKSKSKPSSPTLAAPPSASAGGGGGSTIRVVDDPSKSQSQSQPQPQIQSPFTSAPSLPTDYVLPEISLFSADNGALEDAISITASSSSAHPPSSSPTLVTQPVASTSSSMLRLVNPFRKKSPSGNTHSSNRPSSPLQSDKHEAFLPPLRSSIFSSLDGNSSSQSLPTDFSTRIEPQSLRPQPLPSRTLPLPIPKTPEIRTSTAIKVFNHDSKPSLSSNSSQELQLTSPTQPHPQLHSQLAPQVDDSTFTLKSFRQVRPESPSHLEPPQFPSSTVGVGPRLRGLSNASDTSQRVTVAAFREAQARARTPTNIPDRMSDGMLSGNVPLRPASPAGARPGSAFGTPPRPVRQLPPSSFGRNSPTPSIGRGRTQSPTRASGTRSHNQSPVAARAPAPRALSRLSNHRWAQNTSSEDETSSEGEDDRDTTITKHGGGREQSRVNEIGIGGRPPIRNANGGSSSSGGSSAHGKAKSELGHGHGHSRRPSQEQQWPSASKSELGHGGSLAPILRTNLPGTSLPSSFSRGSFAPPTHPGLEDTMTGTETSENESSQSSDDDMPLSNLLPPRRPGSAMSGARSASPAASARSVPANSNISSTPQNAHPRTSSTSSTSTLDQARRGRQPLVDLSAPVQKDTGKPLHPPTTGAAKKTSPLRSKRSYKDLGKAPVLSAPSSSSSSPSLPNGSPAVHIRQPPSTDMAETITRTRKRSSTIQAGQLPSAKIHSVPLKAAPEPDPVPRFMVFRPFAHADSPPSSIGNSSWSGMLPLTPQTGSEASGSSTSGRSGDQENNKNAKERRKHSVSFVEPEIDRKVEKKAKGMHWREGSEGQDVPAEDKRKERRRGEAKAAIELGRVVNGPAPIVEPEETRQPFNAGAMAIPVNQGAMNSWETAQMQQYLQASQMQPQQLGAMPALNVMPPAPSFGQFNFSNPMMGGMNMGGFGVPNFGMPMPHMPHMPAMGGMMDPGMVMAHQQAMFMAKQAYQLAVAQQAMQAAGDEWERASHVGGYSSPFPPAPASIYAGSALGVPPASVWGGGSAYNMGPGSTLGYPFPMAGSEMGGSTAPTGRGVSGLGPQPQQSRQRTKTAPSSSQPPAHLRGAGAPPLPPPSSWKAR